MDKVDKYLTNPIQTVSIGTQQTGTNTQADQTTANLFNKIFKELVAIHPGWRGAFKSQTELDAAKKQWAKGIEESGIREWELIDAALSACREAGQAFIPPVGVFIGYCKEARRKALKAPETMQAFKAVMGYYAKPIQFRDPTDLDKFTYHTICSTDFDAYYFRRLDSKKAVEYFSKRYQETIKEAISGAEITKPVALLDNKPNPTGVVTKNNKRIGAETLANLKKQLEVK